MKTIEEEAKENCEYIQDSLRQYDKHFVEAFKDGVEFAQRWIPVEEELPPCSDEDLLLKGIDDRGIHGIVDIGYMHDSHDGKSCLSNFMSLGGVLITITHWRPIERV